MRTGVGLSLFTLSSLNLAHKRHSRTIGRMNEQTDVKYSEQCLALIGG